MSPIALAIFCVQKFMVVASALRFVVQIVSSVVPQVKLYPPNNSSAPSPVIGLGKRVGVSVRVRFDEC